MCLFPNNIHVSAFQFSCDYYIADSFFDIGHTVTVQFTIKIFDNNRYILQNGDKQKTIFTTTKFADALMKEMYPSYKYVNTIDRIQRHIRQRTSKHLMQKLLRKKRVQRKWFETYQLVRQQRTIIKITECILQHVTNLPSEIMCRICMQLQPREICMMLQAFT
jgi:hypothetical protein